MKATLIIFIMTLASVFNVAAQIQRMELSRSGSVILTTSVGENTLHYDLIVKSSSGIDQKLSSVEVKAPGGTGKPQGEARYLLSCDENQDMIVVLLATSRWGVILLQYDLITKEVREERLFVEALMEKRRNTEGGTLSVHAPNRITLSNEGGALQSWSVVDGKLIDEKGNVFAQDEGFQMAFQTPETTSPTPVANPVTTSDLDSKQSASVAEAPPLPIAITNETPVSSVSPILWSLIVVLIVAAASFLWLLSKRRS
jgi:hypothetical protein